MQFDILITITMVIPQLKTDDGDMAECAKMILPAATLRKYHRPFGLAMKNSCQQRRTMLISGCGYHICLGRRKCQLMFGKIFYNATLTTTRGEWWYINTHCCLRRGWADNLMHASNSSGAKIMQISEGMFMVPHLYSCSSMQLFRCWWVTAEYQHQKHQGVCVTSTSDLAKYGSCIQEIVEMQLRPKHQGWRRVWLSCTKKILEIYVWFKTTHDHKNIKWKCDCGF